MENVKILVANTSMDADKIKVQFIRFHLFFKTSRKNGFALIQLSTILGLWFKSKGRFHC